MLILFGKNAPEKTKIKDKNRTSCYLTEIQKCNATAVTTSGNSMFGLFTMNFCESVRPCRFTCTLYVRVCIGIESSRVKLSVRVSERNVCFSMYSIASLYIYGMSIQLTFQRQSANWMDEKGKCIVLCK